MMINKKKKRERERKRERKVDLWLREGFEQLSEIRLQGDEPTW